MRGHRRALAVLLALLAAAAPAAAGTEATPEVDDEPDQSIGSVDLLAAWLENEPGGLRFTLKVAAMNEPKPGTLHKVEFSAQGKRYHITFGFDEDGRLRTHAGPPRAPGDGDLASYARDLEKASFTAGRPAYFTGILPHGRLPGVEPGATLIDIAATSGTTTQDTDIQSSRATFRVETVTLRDPAKWRLGAGLVIMGLTMGLATAILLHHRDKWLTPTLTPTQRAERPTGPTRFRLRPDPPPEEADS